ncbi:uncharacterized protein MKK02DRAFT_22728 [Dioszegia hungarica]|uniref:Phosphoglycerate mutase-like protein n=1 Tax=Dioszegia hungarica TaxID=4972 RepID=A0AA38LY32_9TREE|nr:uncharacterized protein MKK02DRAFT_22728 [Dioszegia hungarica]KAI9638251.1 hypothetical protein MKK02DRAFT_22728 [Dioszegia hungarica]
MPLEYIYICRHGFRSNWVDPSIKTGPTGMSRDPPLAAYGLTQSAQLAGFLSSPEALAPHPVPEKVFSSPFYRWVKLEHGVMEWYSPARPGTGLHPRPSSPKTLSPLFPDQLDLSYDSTHFPSRKGELIRDLQDRADTFIEAWTGRVEEMGVRSVVVFGHAASVIALGRALTGNKYLDVSAGCASCSLYKRKTPSTTSTPASASEKDLPPCGVGEWEPVWLGRADYLDNGVERDWSVSTSPSDRR